MNNKLLFNVVDFTNVKEAIEVQKSIFPKEDGAINLLASLDRDLFMKTTGLFYPDDHVKYYLAYFNNEPIGITGLYCYSDIYPNDAWIAWYGVKSNYRGKGFGKDILNWTIEKAKQDNYKTIRLYTDSIDNKDAIKLYEKMGFVGEKYTAEKLTYDCLIYSKSLSENELELWENKLLDLEYQSELDHFDEIRVQELLKKYEDIIKNKTIIVNENMYEQIVPKELLPQRLDSASCLYVSIKNENQEGIIVYNTNPITWNMWYPFFETKNKFTVNDFNYNENITYKELIDIYNEEYLKYEKNYPKEKRIQLLLSAFKELCSIEYASADIDLETVYEIKYSKSMNVYTIYKIESFVLNNISDDEKEKLLNQQEYEQVILPYNCNEEYQGVKVVTNMKYLLENENNIIILKDNAINI